MLQAIALIVALLGQAPGLTRAGNGVVSGQLLPKDGQPVSGVRVSAMVVPQPGQAVTSASTLASVVLTDAGGRYRLENVPPGRYYITAGLIELPTYYPGVATLSEARTVTVQAGATVTGIDFPMAVGAGVTVSGRVIRPAGSVGTLRVALIGGSNPGARNDVAANADGTFQFSRVRPGTYTLTSSLALTPRITVAVADQDVTGLEIVVPPAVAIMGNVVVEGGGLLPRFSLLLSPFSGNATNPIATLLTDGSFRASVVEGEYRFAWSNLPPGYTLKAITAGSVDLLANPLKVAIGVQPGPITITLAVASPVPWVKLSGKVISRGTIPPGLRVNMTGAAALQPLDVAVNPDGTFEVARILPGNYTARVNAIPVPPTAVTIGNRDSALEIMLPPMKDVTGRVTIEGMSQFPPRLTFLLTEGSGTASAAAVAQQDGTFKVTMPEGERRVALNVPGYTVRSLSYGTIDVLQNPALRISAGDSAEFRVGLVASQTPAATVLGGIFVGGGGVPPPAAVIGQASFGAAPPPPSPAAASFPRVAANVAQANLISSVQPVYPELARAARVQDLVVLQATIDKEGKVSNVDLLRGHPLLNQAAIDAVKQWRYKPVQINGQPSEVITTITVNFSFQ